MFYSAQSTMEIACSDTFFADREYDSNYAPNKSKLVQFRFPNEAWIKFVPLYVLLCFIKEKVWL